MTTASWWCRAAVPGRCYRAGELGLDMNDMRPRLAAKGLTYVEQEPDR